jgi:carbonic anhydrase
MKSAALEALERLREGNRRFASDQHGPSMDTGEHRRSALLGGQEPFAVILGCSDSRVPAELIFDQGLGDLFVIRVAGNIVAPSQVGSVEFAVEQCGTRLAVVLGHSRCGAVRATLDELQQPATASSPNLSSITQRIRPAVAHLFTDRHTDIDDTLMSAAVRANVRASVAQLRAGSALIERMVAADELLVVGAEYSLETGVVDFFEGV